MKTSKGNLIALATLALALTPSFAFAQIIPTPSHPHANASHDSLAIHDRTPHVHDHSLVAHR